MGLDMYLYVRKKDWKNKIPKKYLDYNEIVNQENFIKEMGADKVLNLILSKNIFVDTPLYADTVWMSVTQEIGYWRKANAIHNWFVKNIQNGVDDCGYYVVTRENLKKLLEVCREVRDSLENQELVEEIDKDGYKIQVFKNSEIAEKLLPTTEGFFFGGTEYDQYYLENIQETMRILSKIINRVDDKDFEILYHSSW